MKEYLKETKFLNFNSNNIKYTVNNLVKDLQDDKEKSIKIHDFIRDTIMFGFNKKFYDMKASEVLDAKRGFCNNKSTLFVAMLRCAGIPSRIVFVDIDKNILQGIVDPRTDYVDHSYSEVYLNNKWIKVDSYIVDTKLFESAKLKLINSEKRIGYGIHKDGSSFWDGENDSFSQYVYNDLENISTKEYGVYEDIGHFYKNEAETWNKANLIQSTVFFLFSSAMNHTINKIRNENH